MSAVISGFEGIDARFAHKKATGSSDIANFRIRPDGSLEKRYGYRLLSTFDSAVRAMWSGRMDGEFVGYVLIGSTVSRLDFDTGALSAVGTVSTTDTKADFFYYKAVLYLVDGSHIYSITDNGIGYPHGYVPLVGKEWSDTYRGAPNEPRNLLNNKGRITYIISEEPSNFLKTDENISSIDAIYVNGVAISSSSYEIMPMDRTVSVTGLEAGDRVEMFFTYASFPYSEAYAGLIANNSATVFGGINNTRPFLWGGRKGMMYTSSYVSEDALAASRVGCPESDALYFPANYEFTVGDGASAITAVSRHYDRLLIFNENGAWMADSSACGVDDFPVLNINSHAGVLSQGAAAMLGNRPCSVGARSIYRWTSSTEEFDECNAYSISAPIDELLPDGFYSTATVFSDNTRGELYFCSPATPYLVWVYSEITESWVRFDGIDADRFVACRDDIGFIKDNRLYVFDRALVMDYPTAYVGNEIIACFQSNIIDFGTDSPKHLSDITLVFEGGDVKTAISLDGNDGYAADKLFSPTSDHTVARHRLSSPRFGHLRLSLESVGYGQLAVHSVKIGAR